jgi:DNA-binding beta-propeller fold protein YncE
MRRDKPILPALALLLFYAGQAQAGHVYWAEYGSYNLGHDIRQANPDGSNQQTIVSSAGSPVGIALSSAGGHVYWADYNGFIKTANLNGSGQQTLVSGLNGPAGIAVDVAHGRMYWTDLGDSDIRSANLDGSNQTTLIAGIGSPADVKLDVAHGQMYFTLLGGQIDRANLDGSGLQTLVSASGSPHGIALDLVHAKMYWTEDGANTYIKSANLDGTGMQTLLAFPFNQQREFEYIAVDPAGRIYWTEDNGLISSANLDGSNLLSIAVSNGGPRGIALDFGGTSPVPEPASLTLLGLGALGLLCCGRQWKKLS